MIALPPSSLLRIASRPEVGVGLPEGPLAGARPGEGMEVRSLAHRMDLGFRTP